MSIRDDFEGLWNRGEYSVSELLDLYAHELAEKIRDAGEAQVGWGQAMRQAADLIDPQRHCQAWCGCLCHDAGPSPCDDCTGS